jgi:hypothetical protein
VLAKEESVSPKDFRLFDGRKYILYREISVLPLSETTFSYQSERMILNKNRLKK